MPTPSLNKVRYEVVNGISSVSLARVLMETPGYTKVDRAQFRLKAIADCAAKLSITTDPKERERIMTIWKELESFDQ